MLESLNHFTVSGMFCCTFHIAGEKYNTHLPKFKGRTDWLQKKAKEERLHAPELTEDSGNGGSPLTVGIQFASIPTLYYN